MAGRHRGGLQREGDGRGPIVTETGKVGEMISRDFQKANKSLDFLRLWLDDAVRLLESVAYSAEGKEEQGRKAQKILKARRS